MSVEKTLRSITVTGGIDRTRSDAGDTAAFDISITNTGNTRLNQVSLTDDMFGDNITCDYNFNDTTSVLLPSAHPDGAAISCEASMDLTSVDIDAGFIAGASEVSRSSSKAPTQICAFLSRINEE